MDILTIKQLVLFLVISFCLSISIASSADSLKIKEGEHKIITKNESVMHLDKFVMEDHGKISFADDVTRWELSAKRVWFGQHTTIDGNGALGESGKNGIQGKPGLTCDSGQIGAKGGDGGSGSDGVSIDMNIGIVEFKSLAIYANGGNGGRGGQGGAGGSGGHANKCHGGNGGAGGQGGRGGDGGNGGDISIVYWGHTNDAYVPISNYGPGIQIYNLAGDVGLNGLGGQGGEAGKGRFERRASSKKIYRNEGVIGKSGKGGVAGGKGNNGKFLVRPMALEY